MDNTVSVFSINSYDERRIYNSLPDDLFSQIQPDDVVVIKPNWVRESHTTKPQDWEYLITHPAVITAVIEKTCDRLKNSNGKIILMDAPQTDSDFKKILSYYPVDHWHELTSGNKIGLTIIDLRDDEWVSRDGVIIERRKLPGDPQGKIKFNLKGADSEFQGHRKSNKGYYGADYNVQEANEAHDGINNIYSMSASAIKADVFISVPKLKTHKKAGMTSCLKNLVGVNTYKNYLPHYSIGSPDEGGDQYPDRTVKTSMEGWLSYRMAKLLNDYPFMSKSVIPVKKFGKWVFGKTHETIRNGNWHGNDTVWRTILDLNKLVLYGNPDGTMKPGNTGKLKKYIGIVDGIQAGQGFGPLEADPVDMHYLLCGNNPVAIDAVCSRLMGFDPMKIPTIKNSFSIKNYPVCSFRYEEIQAIIKDRSFAIKEIPDDYIKPFTPVFSWKGHIEYTGD